MLNAYQGLKPHSTGVGNIYYVSQAAANNYAYYNDHFGHTYADSSAAVHATIATALTATVAERDDYVIVTPDDTAHTLAAALVMDKRNVHLICPSGMGYDIGAVRSATVTQGGNFANLTMSAYAIEVAGIAFKNKATYSTITLAAGAMGPNVHHNTFYLQWSGGTNSPAIIGVTTGGAWGSIERNWFITMAGTSATCAAVVSIVNQATGCRISNNEMTIGNSNTATIGILNDAVLGATNFNYFSCAGGTGAQDGGIITNCINISNQGSGGAIGNIGGVAAGALIVGGTTAVSCAQNFPAWSTGTGADNGSVET